MRRWEGTVREASEGGILNLIQQEWGGQVTREPGFILPPENFPPQLLPIVIPTIILQLRIKSEPEDLVKTHPTP